MDRLARVFALFACAAVSLAPESRAQSRPNCHPSYVNVCVPPPPPDLDCPDIDGCDIEVVGSDPHHLDRDRDGVACECR